MLKPDQMETLPLNGLEPAVVRDLFAETAVTASAGHVCGVILSADAYMRYRALVYEWARNVPEDDGAAPTADAGERPARPLTDGSTADLIRQIERSAETRAAPGRRAA